MMTSTDELPSRQKAEPRTGSINVMRSSLTIAAGTMTSRVLGFVRGAVLIAVLGAVGVQDSFQVANTLPQQVYGLLAGSVISAVLLPEIVRAFSRPDGGKDYVNRLLTLTGTVLFVMTLVMTVGAAYIVDITFPGLSPHVQNLAHVWSYWFMPQIFFYGMQSVLGQVLNARGHFWEAAWSPVLNNIISIVGLLYYVWLFGWAPHGFIDPADMTTTQIITIAIPTTLGIVAQSVVLVWPLRTVGYIPKFTWGFRGYGLGRAFRIAVWTLCSATSFMVSLLAVQWLASAAEGYGVAHDIIVAGPAARANAFAIYMLPHSVITASIATALFPKISSYASRNLHESVRATFNSYINRVFTITLFFTICLLVFAVPIFQVYAPSRATVEIFSYAQVLRGYAPGLIFLALFIVEVQILLAYALARTSFYGYLIKGVSLVFLALAAWLWTPPTTWVAMGAVAEIVSFMIGAIYLYYRIDQLLPGHTDEKLVRPLCGTLIAAVPAWWVGQAVVTFRGEFATGSSGHILVSAAITCAVGGTLTLITYVAALWLVGNRAELHAIGRMGRRFLPGSRTPKQRTSADSSTPDCEQ